MSIVYVTNKNSGSVYAYESTAKWDVSKQQSRPIRKYLGRVDPVNGQIVPSSGRKGWIKKQEDPISEPNMANGDYKSLYLETLEKFNCCEAELRDAKSQINLLNKSLAREKKALEKILALSKDVLSEAEEN